MRAADWKSAIRQVGKNELHGATIAPAMPKRMWARWGSFSATNASRSEAKIAYVKLNTQTPSHPRGAVPVNQGRTWEALSFCSFRIEFGHGCDCPSYVAPLIGQVLAEGKGKTGIREQKAEVRNTVRAKNEDDFVRILCAFLRSFAAKKLRE
ncbi:MAG: hypothetical protein HY674_11425 [Chloroflexi bacterium]|nr:hypothetical protein [Chloroflexota bacterium]